jgi:outer membrane protein assembly factor BamB
MPVRIWIATALFTACLNGSGRADNWPQFRGSSSSGLSSEKELPVEWDADKNVQWKVKIPGHGWSSPVVWGDKIFVTSAGSDQEPEARGGGGRPGGPGRGGRGGRAEVPPNFVYRWEVYCLDAATGKVVWKQLAREGKPRIAKQESNTYASETPVTDGERIYAYFGMHGVYCYDLAGKEIWNKDLGAYPTQMGQGTASSPVLDGTRLFLQVDNEEKSFLVALDCKTGDELWRVSRSERTTHSSPIIWKNKQRTELITNNRTVRSYDPQTGKLLWELAGGGGNASPVGDEEHLYVGGGGGPGGFGGPGRGRGGPPDGGGPPGGFGGPGGRGGAGGGTLFAVKAGASGNITPKDGEQTSPGIAWSQSKAAPSAPSPLVFQGFVYILEQNNGMVSCYDARSGKPAYKRERLPGARTFWASPWAFDGKIFCLDDSGTTHVIQAGPEFKVLSKNKLNDQCWATPALAKGAVIVRGVDSLYCIKK